MIRCDFRRSVCERRPTCQHDGARSRRIGPPRRSELRVEVFAHVERTGESVAGTCTREDVRYRISAAALGGVAAKFYLAAFDSALHVAHGEVALVRAVDAASVLLQEQHVLALAAEELDVDVPASAEIRFRRSRLGSRAALYREHFGDAVGHDLIVARLHHPGGYRNRGLPVIGLSPVPAAALAAAECDPGLRTGQFFGYFLANNMQLSGIPTDYQRRAVIRKPRRLANRRLDAVNGRYAPGDRVQIGKPLLPLGIVVALYPRFHRCEKTQHFLAPDLVIAARSMMGRARLPSRHQDILAPQQESRALRTANRLTSAVSDNCCAALQV